MRKTTIATALFAGTLLLAPVAANAGAVAPAGAVNASKSTAAGSFVQQTARKKVIVKRRVVRPRKRVVVKRYYYTRSWRPRPHYGRIIAGVTLGTVLGVAIANAIPPRPAPNLCWYWTNKYHTKGYWDYCY